MAAVVYCGMPPGGAVKLVGGNTNKSIRHSGIRTSFNLTNVSRTSVFIDTFVRQTIFTIALWHSGDLAIVISV